MHNGPQDNLVGWIMDMEHSLEIDKQTCPTHAGSGIWLIHQGEGLAHFQIMFLCSSASGTVTIGQQETLAKADCEFGSRFIIHKIGFLPG